MIGNQDNSSAVSFKVYGQDLGAQNTIGTSAATIFLMASKVKAGIQCSQKGLHHG